MPEIIPVGPESEPPPAPVVAAEPAVVVEEREPTPPADDLDDFLDSEPAKAYPDPTPENVRAALIGYADRHGGSTPHAGGRAAARALMKEITGCEVMPQLEAKVKETGDTGWYALIIKAAMDG